MKVFYLFLLSVMAVSCVPSPNSKESPVIHHYTQSPIISGDYGILSQISKLDKVFTINKENGDGAFPDVSISGEGFFILNKTGCLGNSKRCFIRVRFDGSLHSLSPDGEKTGELVVGNLKIPLMAELRKKEVLEEDIEVFSNSNLLEESMNQECLNGQCHLVLKVKNNAQIPAFSSGIQIPLGYILIYNSCNQVIKPKQSCYIRLYLKEKPEDFTEGELALNVGGIEVQRKFVKLSKEDSSAPIVSLSLLNSYKIGNDENYVGEDTLLRIAVDEDNKNRDYFYSVSSDPLCSTGELVKASEENEVSLKFSSKNSQSFYVKAVDYLGKESECIELNANTTSSMYSSETKNLIVTSGSEISLTTGTPHVFESVTIESGGILKIVGSGIASISSFQDFVIDGSIVSEGFNSCGISASIQEPFSGETIQVIKTQALGGDGSKGDSTPVAMTSYKSCQENTLAGTGASGNSSRSSGQTSYNCGNQANPWKTCYRNASYGGYAGYKNGERNTQRYSYSGGTTLPTQYGGAGGQRGLHGSSLVLSSLRDVKGTGRIDLSGNNGQAGEAGQTHSSGVSGGAGGGGAGGNSGDLTIFYGNEYSLSRSNIFINKGIGGTLVNSNPGQDGASGVLRVEKK